MEIYNYNLRSLSRNFMVRVDLRGLYMTYIHVTCTRYIIQVRNKKKNLYVQKLQLYKNECISISITVHVTTVHGPRYGNSRLCVTI